MSIRINQFSFDKQIKISLLSKDEQDRVLNSDNIETALKLLEDLENNIQLEEGLYEPTLQMSGSLRKYKTKNLFTEIFDKQDVIDFMTIAEMSGNMEDEIISGELWRKINSMHKQGKNPLQCMVYSTKYNEKVFYNNEKKMTTWAQVIAQVVNSNLEYTISINHMLVNWSMWKYQITMLITACKYIKKDNKLDEVIRDIYSNSNDDKIRFTVLKRLLYGINEENYKKAFLILRNTDFINVDSNRKYFNLLKRTLETASEAEKEKLYKTFKSTPGFSAPKSNRINSLFINRNNESIADKINDAIPAQKDEILNLVRKKIWGAYSEWRELAYNARNIRQYRKEIQEMFIQKLEGKNLSSDEIKAYSIAIGELDTDGNSLSFLEEKLNYYNDDEKEIMFAYALASISDKYVDLFINYILKYDGFNAQTIIPSVRKLNGPNKNPLIRQYLYSNCLKIKESNGISSRLFKVSLRNLSIFLKGSLTTNVYDIKFDQLLFEFIGYNKIDSTIDSHKCSTENIKLVLDILEIVMDKTNYEGRYMQFTWDLFAHIKNKNNDLANRIDKSVKFLTGQGIPSI